MNIFLNEQAYDLIKDRGVCAPGLVMEALNGDYRLRRPAQKRAKVGQIVRLDLAGDGIERLKQAALVEYPQPLTVSDYVSQKIIEHFGGEK